MLLAALGNSMITNQYHSFEQNNLLFFRNLPFSTFDRLKLQSFTYGLLVLPEFLILLRYLPQEISYLFGFQTWILLLAVLLAFHHFHYYQPAKPEESSGVYFIVFFSCMVLIMYKIPILIPATVLASISFYLFQRYYFKVEYELNP